MKAQCKQCGFYNPKATEKYRCRFSPDCPAGKKKKSKGFTLVELIVVLVILAIVGAVAMPLLMKSTREGTYPIPTNTIQIVPGVGNTVKCIEGYKFIIGASGSATQILNESGYGIPCE